MIHDIDIVLGLTKSKVKNIDALGMKILTDHEDIANARIRFQNGTVCDLTASRVTNDSMRKIRIFQDDCYISIDYMAQAAVIHRKINNQIVSEEIDIKKEAPLTRELASFIDCVADNKKPLVSGKEAYEALKVALDILKKINS
jgi:predicted dehydrogenase